MSPLLRVVRRLAGTAALAAVLVGVLATPAGAHAADAPDATNYRTTITGITPPLAGVSVRAIEAGARLELENRSTRAVEVLGYAGEPYLEVRPDGVYQNTNSPATYENVNLQGGLPVPATADPAMPPQWQKVSGSPVARWHDKRARWAGTQPPDAVAAAPKQPHHISDWTVPLRLADDLSTMEIHGTLDYVPPPSAVLWWALTIVVAGAVAALGLVRGVGVRLLGLVLLVGAAADLAYIVARELDAGARTLWEIVSGVFSSELWPVVAALAALAAVVIALRRRPSALFAVALSGAGLATFGGLVNAAVYFRSVAPVPWSDGAARTAVGLMLALGLGACAAASIKLRNSGRSAAVPAQAVRVEECDSPSETPRPASS